MASQQPEDNRARVAALVALYVLAEQQLLEEFAAVLKRTAATLVGRQAALPKLRRITRRILATLDTRAAPLIERVISDASADGDRAAVEGVRAALEDAPDAVAKGIVPRTPPGPLVRPPDAPAAPGGFPPGPPAPGRSVAVPEPEPFDFTIPHGDRSAEAIRQDLVSELDDVRFRITRLPDDVYKQIAPQGAIEQVLGKGYTPHQAQAIVWRDFIRNGVTGFTDKAGRNWSLSAYTEMAVRTAVQRAFNASHLATMHASGIHYFTVDDDGHPCPFCFPWQGAVLTDGVMPDPEVHVDGTIQQATAAGLFHPNCEHTLGAFIPGFTVRKPREAWTAAMADAYKLTQKQRRLELDVRKAKRQLEYATTPQAASEAAADVRKAQAKVRALVKDNPDVLRRQSRREQPDLSNPKIKLPELS